MLSAHRPKPAEKYEEKTEKAFSVNNMLLSPGNIQQNNIKINPNSNTARLFFKSNS